MRIGMVCPYSFDVPGGVQSHVLQLAEVMHGRGHEVSVLAPSSPHVELPEYVVSGGKAVPIPYTGRWPGYGSGQPPIAWSKGGSYRVISMYCTCTSPTRRACRCWR